MNDGAYILALDQGTSSSRAVLFDRQGRKVGMVQHSFEQIFPRPGWVEHDPQVLWRTQMDAAWDVLRRHGVAPRQVAAIGIANQRETTLLWDRRTGVPLMNAIVWQDRRTAEACERLRRAGHEAMIRDSTGLVLDAYFSASKLQWMLANVPGARRLAERGHLAFGTVDAWLVYRLSGAHVTDCSNAARTMLYNLHTGQWDRALLDLFGIPLSLLPEVAPSSGIVAHTSPLHFGHAIPIAGIAGDQQAATFGQACHHPGMAKNTIGTGSFLLMQTGGRPAAAGHALLSTVGWQVGGRTSYLAEGSVFMAGATLQWLRDGLRIAGSIEAVEALAKSVADADGVSMVPAFTGLGAPHWDPHARGAILGLHRGSTAAHIARAALEGIALQCVDVLHAMQADAGLRLTEMRVDGGGARSDLLMQLMADALGVPVLRPRIIETTALGAAQLAGLAVGFWQSCEEVAGHWQLDRAFDPATSDERRMRQTALWRRAVQRSQRWTAES